MFMLPRPGVRGKEMLGTNAFNFMPTFLIFGDGDGHDPKRNGFVLFMYISTF